MIKSQSNLTFNGKKEVLYGLKKSTQAASKIEKYRSLACGPRPTNTMQDVANNKGEMNAYLDMTINDEAFLDTIKELSKSKSHKIYEELHKNLKPITINNIEFSPYTTFRDAFYKTCKAKLPLQSKQDENVFTKFFDNVSLGVRK